MRYISASLPGLTSRRSAIDDQKPQRPGILAAVISALHHARRLQARRTLLSYEHLVARPMELLPQTASARRNEVIS
jgi:hypothetical protein